MKMCWIGSEPHLMFSSRYNAGGEIAMRLSRALADLEQQKGGKVRYLSAESVSTG